MSVAHINKIATAVPPHQVHKAFIEFQRQILTDPRKRSIFDRLVQMGQIEKRFSCVVPSEDHLGASINGEVFYAPGNFPSTGQRMRQYEIEAPILAERAVAQLELGAAKDEITHLIVTSCTGFSAPGVDLELVSRLGLNPGVERTIVGFMGCYAAINALKLAHHIVRSEPSAKVLVVSIELCTLHFQETQELEEMMPFLLFADGAAAALISGEQKGLSMERFYATVMPEAADQMAWHIRDFGFDMVLSTRIPASVGEAINRAAEAILNGWTTKDIELWAVHPGGRAILDAVEGAFRLPIDALAASRQTLKDFGNMSSATVLFVLKSVLENARSGAKGCAMSFGPGLTAETMLFKAV
ncbi:Naringenin-chalcone synthase [Rhodomicrobium vannielii ATCC 17100]|uniref:Naringenin-chalcone synthase n=1 Tax=Rhodomicrobium vannielii (strain ATCC 17100 / DSM 162 / LMG 4299 / NCIMB 10020 / ATH 3.1.1) TaxID=648757 RepID=E3I5V3_RHOVT|nr:type III polyketide synthase [Rhodomicrobium vannielii]ADP69456.1 Naringenin-chalcone synthase [Rhodomicrobium vannielii ATCC 17100]